jgi:hypothetical protein
MPALAADMSGAVEKSTRKTSRLEHKSGAALRTDIGDG